MGRAVGEVDHSAAESSCGPPGIQRNAAFRPSRLACGAAMVVGGAAGCGEQSLSGPVESLGVDPGGQGREPFQIVLQSAADVVHLDHVNL